MYELIYTTELFEYNGTPLPNLPFIIDMNGYPLTEFNKYIIYLAVDKRADQNSTIRNVAYNIRIMLNKIYKFERKEGLKWDQVTTRVISLIVDDLQRNGSENKKVLKNETVNEYVSNFIGFLWWVEKVAGLRSGLIGINDIGKSKIKYRIALEPGGKSKYKIPFRLKRTGGNTSVKGDSRAWNDALELAICNDADVNDFKGIAKYHRDEILIRLLRETSLRRVEAINLCVNDFIMKPHLGDKIIFITLTTTKIHSERDVGIKVDGLWQDIQEYIETSLKILVPGKINTNTPLIPSLKTGSFFKPNSVNELLKKYGIRPHDGRALGLTELFIELIDLEMDQNSALLLASQQAGHSLANNNKTLLKHYLRAKEIILSQDKAPISNLQLDNARLKQRLKEAVSEIEMLKLMAMGEPSGR
jgi:integrase